MSFKFYTRKESEYYLYCKDKNDNLYWFICPWEEKTHWFQINDNDIELIEISEKQAQKICNNRVFTTNVWVPKKKKGVKIYKTLHTVPNFQFRKLLLFAIIIAIIIFVTLFLVSLAIGKPENFFYFFGGSCIYVFLSTAVDKMFGLSNGEGFFIVLIVALLLGALFL